MTTRKTIRDRLIAGAVGGIVDTVAMTAAMRRLHRDLPSEERYSLPPRQITECTLPGSDGAGTEIGRSFTHLGFGRALNPASQHPVRHSVLMILVHLVWGSVTAIAARELLAVRSSIFAAGPLLDAPKSDNSKK